MTTARLFLTRECFVMPNAVAKWPIAKLSELVPADDKINCGVVQPGDECSEGVPVIRVGDLEKGTIDRASLKCIASSIEASYSRSRLRGDEVLLACVGSIGTVAIAEPKLTGCNIARAVATLRDLVPTGPSIGLASSLEFATHPKYLLV